MKHVQVAVGVIKRDDHIFIAKRDESQHQGGLWEFPGGKIEANESPLSALSRELDEEVGIEVTHAQPLLEIDHDYGDKRVTLHIFVVTEFNHEPTAKEGQQTTWVAINALGDYAFPAANQAIVARLQADHSH